MVMEAWNISKNIDLLKEFVNLANIFIIQTHETSIVLLLDVFGLLCLNAVSFLTLSFFQANFLSTVLWQT